MATKLGSWRTCDLKTVAFLLYKGFEVVGFGREQGRAFFEFEDSDARKEVVLSLWNKHESVEPVAFLESLNRARDMVTQALKA